MKPRAWLIALSMFASAAAAQAPAEVHGSGDAYATRGVALAWGVLRGATEAETVVIIRISADPQTYASLAVAGINPFSKAERLLYPPTRIRGSVDLSVVRSQFAESPRTELRFYAGAPQAQTESPALTVYYLGVPDTTPEFADKSKLDAYLSDRISRARAGMKAP